MDFKKVLKERRSIRRYSSKKVSVSDLTAVCEAARFIPVAGNIYTVRLVIVSDEKKKEQLAEAALSQDFIAKAPFVIVVCSDLKQLRRSYGTRAEIYGKQQAGAAIENMLLKVTELGLASCWVGATDDNAVKRVLKIPEDIQIEALLPLANPLGKEEAKKKPDLSFITYFEKWGQRTAKPAKKPY
ncbi:MAG: nitroreductase family protein [Candidatus Pacearchaeota archaeon]|nr:MAG: nitroreductase family protein [Candidatus Pacearchaeota archaeon]